MGPFLIVNLSITHKDMTKDTSHAETNAIAWLKTIDNYFQIYQFCNDEIEGCEMTIGAKITMRSELGFSGDNKSEVLESLQERVQEDPLSVQIRSGWYSPGATPEPQEFEILLSTGGPALRIIGELGSYNIPQSCELQYQDWGTPWTEYYNGDNASLEWFCQQFYYGES